MVNQMWARQLAERRYACHAAGGSVEIRIPGRPPAADAMAAIEELNPTLEELASFPLPREGNDIWGLDQSD